MKTIIEKQLGDVMVGLYIEDGQLVEKNSYPIAKATEPANALVDSIVDGLEAKIPGDWDKALLEPIRLAAKAEIASLTAE